MERRIQVVLLWWLAAEQSVSSTGVNQGGISSESGSSLFFYQDQIYPRDCKEVQDQCSTRNATGAHLIRPDGYHEPFWVSCSREWTVFQRRLDGFLDFDRSWSEYQDGFGYINVEHWLGNEKLSQLINQRTYELRIEFETESGQKVYLSYDRFRINDEFGDYRLVSLGQHGGTAELAFNVTPVIRKTRRDCYDLLRLGNTDSGDYSITLSGWSGELTVNCNMTIDNGGWTVIQRRIHSSSRLSFDHNWDTYKSGFGDPSGEFWIGNEQLYYLTNQKRYELRIDMVNRDQNSYYAKYDFFRINEEYDKYRLIRLGNFSGTAVFDALRYHQGVPFSTPDQDNDLHQTATYNCADSYAAGWWYYQCHYGDMNYGASTVHAGYWYNLPGDDYLIYSEMKIRPTETKSETNQ